MEEEEGKFSTVVKAVLKRVGKIIIAALVKLLPYIIAAIFICSIIAAVIRFINISNGSYKEGDDTNVPYLVDSEIDKLLDEKQNMIIVKDSIGGGYHYDVDLDKVAEDIITKARDNRTVFDSYISKENQKEYLKGSSAMYDRANELVTKNTKNPYVKHLLEEQKNLLNSYCSLNGFGI